MALWIVATSPHSFGSWHKWRGFRVERPGLWPKVTVGFRSCHALGPELGDRFEEQLDTIRELPEKPIEGQGVCL